MRAQPSNLTIEDARFVFRPNFEGRKKPWETEDDPIQRSFNLYIPEELVEPLQSDGWNVKFTKETEDYPVDAFLPVFVGFKYMPPRIVLIRDGKETLVNEDSVANLDQLEFESFGVVIHPRVWESAMGSGVKAWLKTFYGTVVMDDLERKYAKLRDEEQYN